MIFDKHDNAFMAYYVSLTGWRIVIANSTYLCLAANSIAFFDLYLSLKNPFYPRSKREPLYFGLLVLVIPLTSFLVMMILTNANENPFVSEFYPLGDDKKSYVILLSPIVLVLAAIIPLIMSYKKLSRKGTSKELKMVVKRRYMLYFFFYLILAADYIFDVKSIGILANWLDSKSLKTLVPILIYAAGFPMAVGRLWEPFVLNEFLRCLALIKFKLLCKKKQPK